MKSSTNMNKDDNTIETPEQLRWREDRPEKNTLKWSDKMGNDWS